MVQAQSILMDIEPNTDLQLINRISQQIRRQDAEFVKSHIKWKDADKDIIYQENKNFRKIILQNERPIQNMTCKIRKDIQEEILKLKIK